MFEKAVKVLEISSLNVYSILFKVPSLFLPLEINSFNPDFRVRLSEVNSTAASGASSTQFVICVCLSEFDALEREPSPSSTVYSSY